jgi:hypothetical protein
MQIKELPSEWRAIVDFVAVTVFLARAIRSDMDNKYVLDF